MKQLEIQKRPDLMQFLINGNPFVPRFEHYTSAEMYEKDGLKGYAPMTAKEIETEEQQDAFLNDSEYIIEEKFDGTRALLYFLSDINGGYTRCFSRRVSEKTGWYCENTDSLPQLREINLPDMSGTILDGEMFIPNRPFKDVSSTLNCKWDKAIDRQLELGFIVFHAFDILFYKGIDLRKMPLKRRKHYLKLAVEKINSPYVKLVDSQPCGNDIDTRPYFNTHGAPLAVCEDLEKRGKLSSYPTLYREYNTNGVLVSLSPRAFYEYIVATGGEGVMVKPTDGKYFHKRGREYQKIKKFLTREVVIMGFTNPVPEYKGKFPTIDKWDYWETDKLLKVDLSTYSTEQRNRFKDEFYPDRCTPISKHHCMNWIGTIRFGVVITPEEMSKLPKSKKFNIENMVLDNKIVLVLEVGECSGFDEETREMFSHDIYDWVGKVIEIKANEIFKDTGKLRHPRFMRVREDKSALECTYRDHISD